VDVVEVTDDARQAKRREVLLHRGRLREVVIELDPVDDVQDVVEVEGVIVEVPDDSKRGEILRHRGRLREEVLDVAQRISVQHVVDKPRQLQVQPQRGARWLGLGCRPCWGYTCVSRNGEGKTPSPSHHLYYTIFSSS